MNAMIPEKLTGLRPSGFALLMVLLLITIAAVVGASYIYGSQVKTASTGNLMLASQARYLAESGLEHGRYSLQTRATPFGSAGAPNGPYHVEAGDGGYVFYITSTATPNDYKIVATGAEGGISQTVAMTVRLTNTFAQKMIDLNATHWWRLGDAELTAVDQLGGNNGTYVNGVTRGVEGALLGDADTAAEFGGSNDYVNLGQMASISDSRATFGCWARADAWADDEPKLMSRVSGALGLERRWQLLVTPDRKLKFLLRLGDTSVSITGQTTIELGQWFFVVGVYNRDTRQMRLYLNGEVEATLENTVLEDINDDASLEAWIGGDPPVPGTRPWAGAIDEVFIIKGTAMTPPAVKELFEASIPSVTISSWDD